MPLDPAAQRNALIDSVAGEALNRGISHRQVAREAGIRVSTLHRFMTGSEVCADCVFRLFAWLDADQSEALHA